MVTEMNTSIEKKTVWWREPMAWLVFTLPMVAVIGALTTVWIAYTNVDPAVSDRDSKDIEVTQANDMDKRAHFLSLAANLTAADGTLSVNLKGKLNKMPHHLLLKLAPPTSSSAISDIMLLLLPGQTGGYSATLPSIPAGERRLILEPEDRTWRLTGRWQAPFSGALRLVAKSISDSSMLP